MAPKRKLVSAKIDPARIETVARLARALGTTPSSIMNDLIPPHDLSIVIGAEGIASGGLRPAIERLIVEALIARMLDPAIGLHPAQQREIQSMGAHPRRIIAAYLRFLDAQAHALGLKLDSETALVRLDGRVVVLPTGCTAKIDGDEIVVTKVDPAAALKGCFARLRSDDLPTRLRAGDELARSFGEGAARQGLSPADIEFGAGKDVGDLIGKAMAGDAEAVAQLESAMTAHATEAGATPIEAPEAVVCEPSAEERALAAGYDPLALIDMIAREANADARRSQAGALFLNIGRRASPEAQQSIGAMVRLGARLAQGDAEAIESAREWVTLNLLVRAGEVDQ